MACPPLPPCQMPSLYPAASQGPGGKGRLHPRDGSCGARLMAEMVGPGTGSTHSCVHHRRFGLLRAQSVSTQGIPPWDASGCGEAVQKEPVPPARRCVGSSQEVGWCAVSQTVWALAGGRFQIFLDLPSSFSWKVSAEGRDSKQLYLCFGIPNRTSWLKCVTGSNQEGEDATKSSKN